MATCRLGAFTAVVMVDLQLAEFGQVKSPPPNTVAVFCTLGEAAATGVTLRVKLADSLICSAVAMLQVTCWPCAVQPCGRAPSVKLPGTTSVTVIVPLVGAVPVLVTFST